MNDFHEGGPAFPRPADEYSIGNAGMSLRDWFAGQALCGTMADHYSSADPKDIATTSYAVANAMLQARKASHE